MFVCVCVCVCMCVYTCARPPILSALIEQILQVCLCVCVCVSACVCVCVSACVYPCPLNSLNNPYVPQTLHVKVCTCKMTPTLYIYSHQLHVWSAKETCTTERQFKHITRSHAPSPSLHSLKYLSVCSTDSIYMKLHIKIRSTPYISVTQPHLCNVKERCGTGRHLSTCGTQRQLKHTPYN